MYLNDGDCAIAIYTGDSSGVVRVVTKGEAVYGQALGGFYNQELVFLNSIEGMWKDKNKHQAALWLGGLEVVGGGSRDCNDDVLLEGV